MFKPSFELGRWSRQERVKLKARPRGGNQTLDGAPVGPYSAFAANTGCNDVGRATESLNTASGYSIAHRTVIFTLHTKPQEMLDMSQPTALATGLRNTATILSVTPYEEDQLRLQKHHRSFKVEALRG